MEPDIQEAIEAIPVRVGKTLVDASHNLTESGIAHLVVGGIAVGAYGAPRSTSDVDFMVSRDNYIITKSGLVYIKADVPYSGHDNTKIDYVDTPLPDTVIEYAFSHAKISKGIPVAPVEIIVLMKLISPRSKDSGDIEEMVKAGLPVDFVRKFLVSTGVDIVQKFDKLVHRAMTE